MSPRSPLTTRRLRPLFLLSMAVGAALIARGSVAYFFGGDLHPFVLEKILSGQLASEATGIAALRVHVAAALFALPACLVLTLRPVQRRFPRVHRWLGRATGIVVLFALVPSGVYLALFAKGGAPSTVGFWLSAAITAVAIVQAVRTARARDFAAHRRWSSHVLAQLSVAVSSRALLVLFDRAGVHPELAYITALWVPVVGSAVAAELLTSPRRNRHAVRVSVLAHGPVR
jgi:uncharacterized membrane protein